MKVRVAITLKPGLLDAQGKTITSALASLGFRDVHDVRVGKYVELDVKSRSVSTARREVERMCHKLLANPVVETYRIDVVQGSGLGVGGKRV